MGQSRLTEPPDDAPAKTWKRWLAVSVVVAIVGMWLFLLVLYPALDLGPDHPPDYLDDRAFPEAAEDVCAATRDDLEPITGIKAETPAERADLVEQADVHLRAMLARLDELAPTAGEDDRILTAWLADWHTYLQDRQEWAEAISSGDDVVFYETDRGGEPISRAIDNLAKVNKMSSCETPDNV